MEKLTQEELMNLSAVFAIARKELASDRDQIIALLNLEAKTFELLKPEKEENV